MRQEYFTGEFSESFGHTGTEAFAAAGGNKNYGDATTRHDGDLSLGG